MDKDSNPKLVEVYDDNDTVKISFKVNKIKYKTTMKEAAFNLDKYVTNEECKENCSNDEQASKLENAIYPLYVPSNTYLSSSEMVNDEENNRAIITFSGEKNYVLIEEASVSYLEHEIIPVYGEPVMLNDTIAAMSSNSLNWSSNGINYYLASEDLTISEMVNIAQSLANAQNVVYIK